MPKLYTIIIYVFFMSLSITIRRILDIKIPSENGILIFFTCVLGSIAVVAIVERLKEKD